MSKTQRVIITTLLLIFTCGFITAETRMELVAYTGSDNRIIQSYSLFYNRNGNADDFTLYYNETNKGKWDKVIIRNLVLINKNKGTADCIWFEDCGTGGYINTFKRHEGKVTFEVSEFGTKQINGYMDDGKFLSFQFRG